MTETFRDGHFYSPVPDTVELDGTRFEGYFDGVLAIDEAQLQGTATEVFACAGELIGLMTEGETPVDWENTQFPPADSLAYYGMVRCLSPRRILEVGSGSSTLVALEALAKNGSGSVTCVEPYPKDFLREDPAIELIELRLQEAPDSLFSALQEGDILFIDSSHQVKCQSDVLDLLFRVIDLVRPGVYIHIHDIFYPDDYPEFWLKERGIFFNEQYFLLAFLKDNPRYEVVLPNALLVRKMRAFYESLLGENHCSGEEAYVNQRFDFIKAGSFWMRKLR